jgi:hypothetical protein
MATKPPNTNRKLIRIDSGWNVALGVWLVAAPFILGYASITAPLWNDILVGLTIAILTGIRAFGALNQSALSWTNVALGVWLVAAPFILGYSGVAAALWNDLIVGLLVAILAWRSAVARPQQNTT